MPSQEERFGSTLHFAIEPEYKETIEKIAKTRGLNKSQVCRKLIKENLEDFVNNEDSQMSLTEDLEKNGI
jgi:hypothetical protein